MNLRDKKILIIGGNGLLGKPLQELLTSKGISFYAPRSQDMNVLDSQHIEKTFREYGPDIVFNLFVSFGGIIANARHPGKIFYDNLIGNVNVVGACVGHSVKKLIQVGTQCSYADTATPPFMEDKLWDGYPTENNAPYGIAKRAIHTMIDSYRKEYGLNGIYLIPSNMYGPYDNFHPEHTHVIPALIRRFIDAKEKNLDSVEIWGTGYATREFLYNYDCANALIDAAEQYDSSDPVNLGSGKEVTIRELVSVIQELVGYEGNVWYNNNGLDGQARRLNSIERAKNAFGFEPRISLRDGLIRTINYYKLNRDKLRETKIYE